MRNDETSFLKVTVRSSITFTRWIDVVNSSPLCISNLYTILKKKKKIVSLLENQLRRGWGKAWRALTWIFASVGNIFKFVIKCVYLVPTLLSRFFCFFCFLNWRLWAILPGETTRVFCATFEKLGMEFVITTAPRNQGKIHIFTMVSIIWPKYYVPRWFKYLFDFLISSLGKKKEPHTSLNWVSSHDRV